MSAYPLEEAEARVEELERELGALKSAARDLAIDANRILERPRQGTYDDDLERSLKTVQKLLGMHVRGT